MGLPPIAVLDGLKRFTGVPGRFEPVPNDRGISVLVDYAHTPDALATATASLREITTGKVITVFGCGGDRDHAKRPEMAANALAGSDSIIITSDNPRSESPEAIIEQILAGLPADADPGSVHVEPDRRAAIAKAIGLAQDGDAVLIAGKGHEKVQIIGDKVIPFDDRKVAAEVLSS